MVKEGNGRPQERRRGGRPSGFAPPENFLSYATVSK